MSKSKLKPEDIFFGIEKTEEKKKKPSIESRSEQIFSAIAAPAPATTEVEVEVKHEALEEPAMVPEKKKRGPAPKVENSNRVAINVLVAPEVKYNMVAIINEMKLRGVEGQRYSITDFVAEAIEEKVARARKNLEL